MIMDTKSTTKANAKTRAPGSSSEVVGKSDACTGGAVETCGTGGKSEVCGHSHEGKLVRVSGNTLVMTNCEGQEHSHSMAPDAKVSCDGSDCRVQDLTAGSKIRVTTKPDDFRMATKVESLNKQADFAHSA